MVDPVEVGIERDHLYADTFLDFSLFLHSQAPELLLLPTPSLDSISDSIPAENQGEACTLKEILRMQVCLLEQLMAEYNHPPQVPSLDPVLSPTNPYTTTASSGGYLITPMPAASSF